MGSQRADTPLPRVRLRASWPRNGRAAGCSAAGCRAGGEAARSICMREAGVAHARFDAYQLSSARSPRHAKGRDARFFRILARVSRWGVCSLPVVTPRRPSCRAVAAGAWPRRRRSSVRQALTDDTLAGGPRSPWVLAPPPPPFLALLPSFAPPPPPSTFAGAMDDPTPAGETVFLRPEASAGLSYTFLGTSKMENGIPTYSMLRAGTTIYAVGDNVLVNCGDLEHPWIAKILLFYRDPSGNMCVFERRRGGWL